MSAAAAPRRFTQSTRAAVGDERARARDALQELQNLPAFDEALSKLRDAVGLVGDLRSPQDGRVDTQEEFQAGAPPTGVPKTFEKSEFKRLYETVEAPKNLFDAVHMAKAFIDKATQVHCIPAQSAEDYKGFLSDAVFEKKEISNVAELAAFLWTTQYKLGNREFCSFVNEATREDDGPLLSVVVPYCRLLNKGLVSRGETNEERRTNPEKNKQQTFQELVEENKAKYSPEDIMTYWKTMVKWTAPYPPNNTTYRGLGLPLHHREFFKKGVKFRTRMYFASSFDRSVSVDNFAKSSSYPATMFEVTFDDPEPVGRGCLHARYLDGISACGGEAEWLLPPYSVFEVLEDPAWETPESGKLSEIKLRALYDNQVSGELPVAPWT